MLLFQAPLAGVPFSGGMAVRIVGAIICGAGCAARAVALVDDDDARRRALGC